MSDDRGDEEPEEKPLRGLRRESPTIINSANTYIININIINNDKKGDGPPREYGSPVRHGSQIKAAFLSAIGLIVVLLVVSLTVPNWQLPVVFIAGVCFFIVLLGAAIFIPKPTEFQYLVFRIVLSLAAAAFAAPIPGLLNVTFPGVTAGGALAVFALVFWRNPAALIRNNGDKEG